MSAGADPDAKNHAGYDPAFEAEQAGKEDVATWLVNAGGDKEDAEPAEEEVAEDGGSVVDGDPEAVEEKMDAD